MADEIGVKTRTPNPRSTKNSLFSQKNDKNLEKQLPKHMISNVRAKFLINVFIQTANTYFKLFSF